MQGYVKLPVDVNDLVRAVIRDMDTDSFMELVKEVDEGWADWDFSARLAGLGRKLEIGLIEAVGWDEAMEMIADAMD
jgi:hypothetical protein